MNRKIFLPVLFLLLLLAATQAIAAPRPPLPPAHMYGHRPGSAHAASSFAVPIGPCWLHAYPPGINTSDGLAFAYGGLTCSSNQHSLELEVCPQIWTGSSWVTKTGGPGPNGTYCAIWGAYSNIASIGAGPYAGSYGWQCVNGHGYRTWDWGDVNGTYTSTYTSGSWTGTGC